MHGSFRGGVGMEECDTETFVMINRSRCSMD